ncbi:mechanosensitive ion channel family protein [Robertkochia flava]|uniref:mechanosensitive ion channel family protein n=1 Tax=Robertkochia flava TaxID=3447986 RepID=UPI001CC9627B|nr:mechanosensitive ion channel domain-containing protein [Robertkochia marina]
MMNCIRRFFVPLCLTLLGALPFILFAGLPETDPFPTYPVAQDSIAGVQDSLALKQDTVRPGQDAVEAGDSLAGGAELIRKLWRDEFSTEEGRKAYQEKYPPAYVVFEGDTLFRIYDNLGPFGPGERARAVSARIEEILESGPVDLKELKLSCDPLMCRIVYKDILITTMTLRQADLMGSDLEEMAQGRFDRLYTFMESQKDRSWTMILKRQLIFLVALVFFVVGFKYLNRFLKWLMLKVLRRFRERLGAVKFNEYEFLSRERSEMLVLWLLNILKNIGLLVLIYFYSLLLFTIFPKTEPIAMKLFNYVVSPLEEFGLAIIGFVPNLITIAVIIFLVRYLKKGLRFLTSEVERGKLEIPGFYPDWAQPTYRLISVIITLFAFVVIFPYLPGSDSPAFQGVSVFLGLLLSLGSTSAISNIIAGLVIIYMRSFKIGDRVKIGDTTGDVIEKTMLITRLRTVKNEEVTLPNSTILNGSTINYTSGSLNQGLIVHTTVTIGYDVPWKQVHELLLEAAAHTELIKKDPKPFVLQTSLDDFFISYQLNGYTDHVSSQGRIYSELHANIQDAFNNAGVEILSPHYRAERDGNASTIPPPQKSGAS